MTHADWPAPGWIVHEILPELRVRVTRAMPKLPAALEGEVDRLWQRAQARTDGRLFNGRVFSADHIAPSLIGGHWTEYRRIVAQIERPDLFGVLAARPVAVGGTIIGPDGVVIGRRPPRAVYQAGMWQLPPAGSLDPRAAGRDSDDVAFIQQVLAELGEEIGMGPETVTGFRPLCVVEHPGSHVCDLGVAMRTRLRAGEIAAAHALAPDAEYDPLRVVPLDQLAGFVAEAGAALTPQALVFLVRAGVLPGPQSEVASTSR